MRTFRTPLILMAALLAVPAAAETPPAAAGATAAADPGMPFERLGEFRLVRKLGEGGMGIVYLAVQESLGRQVALKVIRPERVGSYEAETRFWREVEALAKLRHENIVTVYGSGEEQGVRYFAMELVTGRGLDEVLHQADEDEHGVPIPDVLAWIESIASATAATATRAAACTPSRGRSQKAASSAPATPPPVFAR